MADDVLGRDATLGEEGFIGNGGGARSGSELSHLESRVSAFCAAEWQHNSHGNNCPAAV